MARRGRIINVSRGIHPVGRLKSPVTHLMGTAFQSQHMGDLSNQQTLHGASGTAKGGGGRVNKRKKRRYSANR